MDFPDISQSSLDNSQSLILTLSSSSTSSTQVPILALEAITSISSESVPQRKRKFRPISTEYKIIPAATRVPILTPCLQERKVCNIELQNGLQVRIISDPGLIRSGAALSVETGSWHDPENFPGLAHFIEHMLFLGSKKYPNEHEFSNFIETFGGCNNACTDSTHTIYKFSLVNDQIIQALDRFADMFTAPLFKPDCIKRELHAVDAEWQKNFNNDAWRRIHVMKSLADPNHPFKKFDIGNLACLKNASQRDLIKWYNTHYSANLMHLVVYSTLSLETMINEITPRFGAIHNNNLSLPSPIAPLCDPQYLGKIVTVPALTFQRTLILSWELPVEFFDHKKSKPHILVSELLSQHGPGTLIDLLKEQKLAHSLYCDCLNEGSSSLAIELNISLTEKGLKERNSVLKYVYQALAKYRALNIPKSFYNDLKNNRIIAYHYQSRRTIHLQVEDEAKALTEHSIDSFPENHALLRKYRPNLYLDILNLLIPSRCLTWIIADPSEIDSPLDQVEPWMNVSYRIDPIDPTLFDSLVRAEPSYRILPPPKNPFSFPSVQPPSFPPEDLKKPIPLKPNALGMAYFLKDTYYLEPRATIAFQIRTPLILGNDPKSMVLAKIFELGINHRLTSLRYQGMQAGLKLEIESTNNGFTLFFSGFTPNMGPFLQQAIKEFIEFTPAEAEFKSIASILQEKLQRKTSLPPDASIKKAIYQKLFKRKSTLSLKKLHLNQLTFSDFQEFNTNLFKKVCLRSMIFGNIEKQRAEDIWKGFSSQFPNSKPYKQSDFYKPELHKFHNTPLLINVPSESKGAAAGLLIELGRSTPRMEALQKIAHQAFEEPFFYSLRTRKQLGYTPQIEEWLIYGTSYLLFALESPNTAPRDLISIFEAFIRKQLKNLGSDNGFNENKFEDIRGALIEEYWAFSPDLETYGRTLTNELFETLPDFNWSDKVAMQLQHLTFKDLTDFMRNQFGPANKHRLACVCTGQMNDDVISYKEL